jgi:3-oxoacyl-[acyl-carrier protein] reductase
MSVTIDLSDRIALITGASQGIGAAIARRLHEAGAFVYLNHPNLGSGKTKSDAETLASSFNNLRPNSAQAISADVSKPAEVSAMIREIASKSSHLDILVNNAGILRDRTVAKMSIDEWDAVIDVNLSGVFHTCKAGLEIMRDGGSIVNLGSLSASAGFHGQANYSAAKAGVQALSRVLSRECARKQIRVNALAPGVIDTDMVASIPDEYRAEMIKQVPLRRLGHPTEIADAVLFLCSPLASYITGIVLEIDGGWRG